MAGRLMIFRNGRPSPLRFLLRGSASSVSKDIKSNDIADPKLLFWFHQTPVLGNSNTAAIDIDGAFFQGDHFMRFAGFGKMDKMQLRENVKAVPVDDYEDEQIEEEEEEDDDDEDYCDDDGDFDAEDFDGEEDLDDDNDGKDN